MQKSFTTILLFTCIAKLNLAYAADGLCPAPNTNNLNLVVAEHPSAEIYHQSMQQAVLRANQSLDWIIDPNSDSLCDGYYQAADNPNPQKNSDPDDADVLLSADAASKGEDGFTTLEGNVELYHADKRIRCDVMRYSDDTQYSDASGNLQLRQSGLLLLSKKASFDNIHKTSQFDETEYVLHNQQAHGKADVIRLDANSNNAILTLRQTSFTVCPPTAELWSFDARKLEIDYNKGWGKMYSAFFKVSKVPIIYIPYVDFPIDKRRKTGLLWPSFSSAEHGGIDITLPYYFNIAPQADLTYVPHHNSDHGTLHGVEARYKQRYAEWSFGGAYLENDERVGDVRVSTDPALDGRRWLGFAKEAGRFNANWSTEIDYQTVSDMNYFRDWGANGFDIQKSLNIRRFATLNFSNAKWKASTTVVDYQSLELDPLTQQPVVEDYSRLPEIDVLYRNGQDNFSLHPVFFGQYTFFDHTQKIRGQRSYLDPGIQFPMRWESGEIIPSFRIKYRQYRLNESNDINNLVLANTVYQGNYDTIAPSFTLNNRLFFEKQTSFFGSNYTETLTPRLYYYYADYQDQRNLPNFDTIETAFSYQQLFRDTRFGSFDRIGDANQVSIALESALINDNDGAKLFSLGVGQIVYFQDRRVTAYQTDNQFRPILLTDSADIVKEKKLINQEIDKRYYRDYSDIALEPTWYIDTKQRLTSSLIVDPKQGSSQEAAIGYHYSDVNQTIVNVTYRYKKNPYFISNGEWVTLNNIDQTDVSAYFPINKNWHGYMRWNYDITNRNTIENMTGVKYEGCCVGVMFAYQRERKTFDNNIRLADSLAPSYDSIWFIQFELKGLGGITNTITHLLEESIQGFKQRETNL